MQIKLKILILILKSWLGYFMGQSVYTPTHLCHFLLSVPNYLFTQIYLHSCVSEIVSLLSIASMSIASISISQSN